MRARRALATALAALACGAGGAWAQARVIVADAGPEPIARDLRAALLDRATRVIVAPPGVPLQLTADSIFSGALVVLASRVTMAGRAAGDVYVVGGDLFVYPRAAIGGRAVAIGGAVYASSLAIIARGTASYRDFTYDRTGSGDAIALRYRSLRTDQSPPLTFPGLFGIRAPLYDRINGVSLRFAPNVSLAGERLGLEPALTYRSALGAFDPSLRWNLRVSRTARLDGALERASLTNDAWIVGNLTNSVRSLVLGHDARNWYRADRADARMHLLLSDTAGRESVEPYVGVRSERAWSVARDSGTTTGPWSLHGRRSSEGMARRNPAILPGTITSALAGAKATWQSEDIVASGTADLEVPVHAPHDLRFTQITLHGQIAFPTFGSQRFRAEAHAVLTAGDTAPPQRWAYLGGTGSLPTTELLEFGGDQSLFLETRYEIPIERVKVRFLGSPTITLRHILGSAAPGGFAPLVEILGLRASFAFVRADLLTDTAVRRLVFHAGLAITR